MLLARGFLVLRVDAIAAAEADGDEWPLGIDEPGSH